MKKVVLFFLAVLTATAMVFSLPAAPAAAAGTKSISLAYVHFVPYKGFVFVFNVKGAFDDFKGAVSYAGLSYPLSCNFRDDGMLSCVMSGGKHLAGKKVSGAVNGFAFSATVPYPQYCYSVFDDMDIPDDTDNWGQIGTYCQEESLEFGDAILFDNPYWNDTYNYVYSPDGQNTMFYSVFWWSWYTPPVLGPGLYYAGVWW